METVTVTRYVTPLREGGSMPAIVEGHDDGLYVLKFRGAGQGVRALIAEILAGGIARGIARRLSFHSAGAGHRHGSACSPACDICHKAGTNE